MKSYIKAAAAILSQLGSLPKIEAALKIGDVVCITGYVRNDSGLHVVIEGEDSLGYRLDDTGTPSMSGSGEYQATVVGTVSNLGDGSNYYSPMLSDYEMMSSDTSCDEAMALRTRSVAASTDRKLQVGDEGDAVDCTSDFCENQLAENFLLRYRINVPQGSDPVACEECTITMQAIYDGVAWVSIAFSTDGSMIGSEAVM
jgi:hypothetical protein